MPWAIMPHLQSLSALAIRKSRLATPSGLKPHEVAAIFNIFNDLKEGKIR
jgi:hypothetical protein